MIVHRKVGLRGRFQLTAIARDGSRRELADFPNLILDGGLDRLGSLAGGNPWNYACLVGSDNTPPTTGDTTLGLYVASVTGPSSSYVHLGPPDYIAQRVMVYTFGEGDAAGNLSEVGIGSTAGSGVTNGPLFSRALILDGAGNPTTITVLATEVLQVTYTLELVPDLSDSVFSITIDGVDTDCVMRPAQVTSDTSWDPMRLRTTVTPGSECDIQAFTGGIGVVTGQPSGTAGTARDTATVAGYISSSYYNDFKGVITPAQDNLTGGYGAMTIESPIGKWQLSFDPPVAKDNTKQFEIIYRVSWGRV